MNEKAPLTDASLARLAMSWEARKLSHLACDLVPVTDGELHGDGSGGRDGHLTEQALELYEQARALLERTVVYERLGGANWDRMGTALGITRQSAEHLYSGAEEQFRQELAIPVVRDEESGTLHQAQHPAAADPERTARILNEWTASHYPRVIASTFYPGSDKGASLVLDRLARMNEDTELRALHRQREQILRAGSPAGQEEDLDSIARREQELLQRQSQQQASSYGSRGTARKKPHDRKPAGHRKGRPLP